VTVFSRLVRTTWTDQRQYLS